MHNPGLVGAVLHLTGFGIFHRLRDVRRDGAHFGVRHQTARAENLAQLADDFHRVRRGNRYVEIHLAFFDQGGEIVETNDFGTGFFGCFSRCALREYRHAH